MIVLFGGFILGLKHALDADHLAAMAAIAAETKNLKKASVAGLAWGLGHTVTLFVIGSAVLYFKLTIAGHVASGLESIAGMALIILGLRLVWQTRNEFIHSHPHEHDGRSHEHLHSDHSHSHWGKPFVVGVMHGLAGSAALSLLALTTAESFALGSWFIILFGIGSVLGMIFVSTLISVPLILTSKINLLNKSLRLGAGLISITIGIMTVLHNIPTFLRK